MGEKEPIGARVSEGMRKELKRPWERRELILVTLEKAAKANKELVELIRKTNTVLEVLLKTLAEIFTAPNGGGELVELMIKSVAGTVDLITITVREVDESPVTIYLKLNDIFKNKPVTQPMLESTLNAKQSKTSRDSMRSGFEITIDEKELKRQVIEELDNANKYRRGCVFENIPAELAAKISQIQHRQQVIHQSRRSKAPTDLNALPAEVADKLSRPTEKPEFESIDLEEDLGFEFSGFASELGEPDPELNEELRGFDNVDEFGENESPESDPDLLEDFVTVKGEDDDPQIPIEVTLANNFKNMDFRESSEDDKEDTRSEKKELTKADAIIMKARCLKPSRYKDDYRVPGDDKVGGMPLIDKKVMQLLRDVAKEYLKQFFGRIFSGNFNLTTISFPIKCMRPLSLLQSFGNGGALNSIYLTKAASITDPVERAKYVICAQLATFYSTSSFLKPVPLHP